MKTAIVAVPRLEPHRPPPGSAIIANVCQQLGHEVQVFDLNIKFFHFCRDRDIDFYEFDPVWDEFSDISDHHQQILDEFVEHWSNIISTQGFDYVLFSIFGSACRVFTNQFLSRFRPRSRAVIVAGGNAVNTTSLTDPEQCYGRSLRDQNLIDHFITGEGEEILAKFFAGESGPGINNTNPQQIEDINQIPLPDYGFFDLDEYDYLYPGEREVYITGSRGCVRKCTYCDVERFWPRFRYRSGDSIAQEIIENYERFGITRFYFTDSLVNGSLKAFNQQCERLMAYRFDRPIRWSGQFIFRQRRSIPRDHYEMIARAGGSLFYVGIETGSDKIRAEMGKNFTNDDIDFQLEECSRWGIKIMPLMFTGYVTETLQDHHDNLAAFQRWQRFVADGTIIGIDLGSSLIILPGAPVERMIQSHGIEFVFEKNDANPLLWWSAANPELTISERIRRKLEVHETATALAWPVWRQESRLNELKQMILQHRLWEPKKFFAIRGDGIKEKAGCS
jgi:hypothetical protein